MAQAQKQIQQNNKQKQKQEQFLEIMREPGRRMTSQSFSQEDVIETQKIEKILIEDFKFTENEIQHKEEILAKLGQIIKEWVFNVVKEKLQESIAAKIEAKLFTFGSYRLKVDAIDGDIDTCLVVPKYISKENFFNDLYQQLKEHPKVNDILKVPDAFVPIISLNFDKIPIDISYSQLDMETIDDNLDLQDNKLLQNIEKKDRLSINGRRVADIIIENVPNLENFRTTLRCIKVWAKNKGLYSHKFGYLGGVSWAILVAKICQMYPNQKPNQLLEKFFKTYSSWDWNQIPVLIKQIQHEESSPLEEEVWNQANDFYSKMFVITPAYPSMNSSHNINSVTINIFKKFFMESSQLINNEIKTKKQSWKSLFTRFQFFEFYKHFIQIQIVGNNKESFMKWQGIVESKLKRLYLHFSTPFTYYQKQITEYFDIHLFPVDIEDIVDPKYQFCVSYFVGLKIKDQFQNEGTEYDFHSPIKTFCMELEQLREDKENTNLKIFQITQAELPISLYNPEQISQQQDTLLTNQNLNNENENMQQEEEKSKQQENLKRKIASFNDNQEQNNKKQNDGFVQQQQQPLKKIKSLDPISVNNLGGNAIEIENSVQKQQNNQNNPIMQQLQTNNNKIKNNQIIQEDDEDDLLDDILN